MDRISHLFKTFPIKGKFTHLYHVDINDANLILKLRTEERDDNHLMSTEKSLHKQKEYLVNYKKRFELQEEIYYKVYDVQKKQFLGFVRLTRIQSKDSFSWESAVLDKSSSPNLFLDLMLVIFKIGFDYLDRDVCGPWKVKKQFKKMMRIHEIVGMTETIMESEDFYEVLVKKENYKSKIDGFNRKNIGIITNLRL